MMISDSRLSNSGLACRVLGILVLIAIICMAGCQTSSNIEGQLAVTTLSGGLPAGSVSAGGAYPSTTLAASGGTAPYTWAVTTGALPAGLTLSASGTISGSPTTAGTDNFTITVTDAANHTATANLSITINPKLTITTPSGALPTQGVVGSPYAATALVETGGVGPFTWVLKTGNLPGGLSLSASGTISGTILGSVVPGIFPFTVQVTDSQGNVVVSGTISIIANAVAAITSATNTTFSVGTLGSFAVTATGSPAPSLSESGALPNGVTFNTATGVLSGTPAAGTAANYPITFTAHNGIGADAVQNFTLTVGQSASITSASSTTLTVGTPGSFTVTATGFPVPTLLESGTLPNGVTFNAATGLLSGTPAAGAGGSYPLTFTAHNGIGADAVQNFTLTVNQTAAITSANSSSFTVGVAGSFTVVATGFPVPSLSESGALPNGVTFNTATGVLSGTPAAGTAANYPISFTAHNGIGADAVQNFTLTVTPTPVAPAITSSSGTTLTVGTLGSFTVTATGSPTPNLAESGVLPNGVTFNTTTGVLSGTPTAGTGGTYPLTFTAHNGVGSDAVQSFTLTVDQTATITTTSTTTFTVGSAGTFTVTAAGFPAPTLSESGPLPNGVTFNSTTGVLSGTPAMGTAANYPITFTAHNGIGTDAMQNFTLKVNQVLIITSANNATFNVGGAETFTVTTTGFPQPSLNETGVLPSGITFTDNGNGTATLGGTPAGTSGGNYSLTITASNGVETNATQSFTLLVDQPLSITSANSTTFATGIAGTFTVTTTGFPKPSLRETGALPSGVTFIDNGNGTATLAGTPAATSGGNYTVTITASDGIVEPSVNQTFTLTVDQPLAITSANSTTFTVGSAGTFTVATTGFPKPSLAESGALPGGVTFVDNGNGTATLTGTPASANSGVYSLTITANDGGVEPNATQTFTLTVNQSLGITSANNATFAVATAGTFTVTATGFPAPSLSETGALPTGVTFNTSTGVLSGTPAAGTGGLYPITFTAHNGVGTDALQSFTLTIDAAAAITSVNNAVFTIGTTGTFTVTATGFPAPTLAGSGALPTGVTFNTVTGVLSGTPNAGTGGIYNLTFTAHNSSGPDATQSFTFTVATALPSVGFVVPGPVFANGNSENIPITVTNDQAGDVLTVTGLSVGGVACTLPSSTNCGTLGSSITGTSGSGSYSLTYLPPSSANINTPTTFTLVISSSLLGSFAATGNFTVNPAGAVLVTTGGPNARVQPNGVLEPSTFSATIYNDIGAQGATISLLASGYACPSLNNGTGATACGTLIIGSTTTGTTTTATTGIPFTKTNFTFVNPTGVPNPPYDRPMVLAVSKADPTKTAQDNFLISTSIQNGLFFPNNSRLASALAATGAAPITIQANINGDTGTNKTVTWTLQASGSNCQPACGVLGTPAYTWNGNNNSVTATIPYTPPATVPSGQTAFPTITATSVDNAAATDSFTFQIVDGSCGTGHESILNGQYAFLAKGGGATVGYDVFLGSFTANGTGGIMTGTLDINRTVSTSTGLTILAAGSSYSVGADNRGCLTLVNSAGGSSTYRIALGTLSSGVATQGSLVAFTDNSGQGQRVQGVLMKQDPTAFTNSAISGNFVFGDEGIDASGGRIAVAGVTTANGTGVLSNFDTDTDDYGTLDTNDQTGSGTYNISATGRGTATFTRSPNPTANTVFQVVSASEILSMTTDPLTQATPILSGDYKKQTVASFTGTEMNNSGYAFYGFSIDGGNGGDNIIIGQAQITTGSGNVTNGTVTLDQNDNGVLNPNNLDQPGPEQSSSALFTIGSNGRMTITGVGNNPPIFYLTGPSGGFLVGTDQSAVFGRLAKQTGTPFSTSTITGQFFFGGQASTNGSPYDSGTVNFTPGTPNGTITGTDDSSSPANNNSSCPTNCGGSLDPNSSIANNGSTPTYSFSTGSTVQGQGTVGTDSIAYIISPTQVIFLQTGQSQADPTNVSPAELFIIQQ